MIKPDAPIFDGKLPSVGMIAGVRSRLDSVFADSRGQEKPGIRKRAEECIRKLQEPLRKLLADDEVMLVAVRCLPPLSALEQYFLSWAVTYSHSTVLIITNKRLLHFGVSSSGAWRKNVRELSWEAVTEARVKGIFSWLLQLQLGDGTTQRYWRIRKAEAKKIRALLPVFFPADAPPRVATAQPWVSLCPECFRPLAPRHYLCASCGLVFKDERGLILPLALVPGGGYFYSRQPLLGFLHAIGEGIFELWILVLLISLITMALNPKPGTQMEGFVTLIVFCAVFLGFEKLVAFLHRHRFVRNFIPTDKHDPAAGLRAQAAGMRPL